MGSSSGKTMSSGGSDLQEEMDQRKRRRMMSNRESAKRSRMRKQKHLNDLMTRLSQLRSECDRVMTGVSIMTRDCVSLEAENSVLRAQVTELSYRLRSLIGIIAGSGCFEERYRRSDDDLNDSSSCLYACCCVLTSNEMITY
ncbi:hypothetical protein QVD17_05694 [Tagetes erecta]|uniref:BZIP domain-containing protein n=1 Tax=Tagetes erecta TaxID=13708 RepID=A0AAD8LKA6_TARER|nr:hypothetical protein QVD17_05694 [Tagetes erecta]